MSAHTGWMSQIHQSAKLSSTVRSRMRLPQGRRKKKIEDDKNNTVPDLENFPGSREWAWQ